VHEITLKGMRFHARVGIIDHERTIAQPIEVDLSVRVASGEGIVDYRGLYASAADVLAADPIEYLEEIAERVAENALRVSPRVIVASVAVRKPHVALGGPLDYAEVRVDRGPMVSRD
jgi:7,8-dihydroneopterin aldolase/epimerase/oxygenase